MGFIYAVATGISTIVTSQGLHFDVDGGITHPIDTVDDLAVVLTKIGGRRRQRISQVVDWSW